MDLLPIVW